MPLISRGASLQMKWCLDCHRNPEDHVRPPEEVFNFDWQRPDDPTYGAHLVEEAGIEGQRRLLFADPPGFRVDLGGAGRAVGRGRAVRRQLPIGGFS